MAGWGWWTIATPGWRAVSSLWWLGITSVIGCRGCGSMLVVCRIFVVGIVISEFGTSADIGTAGRIFIDVGTGTGGAANVTKIE